MRLARRKRGEERRQRRSILDQARLGWRMLSDVAIRRVGEEASVHEAAYDGERRFERGCQRRPHVVPVDPKSCLGVESILTDLARRGQRIVAEQRGPDGGLQVSE